MRTPCKILIALTVCLFIASAQSPTPPYALFQNAVITASGNTINATRIPVITQSGVPVYVNMSLQFNVDPNGNLSISNGYPQYTASPMLLTSQFKAGTYVGPSTLLGGKAIIVVSGPGVASGGATQWTISAGSGADACTVPLSATWYDGPISSNPNGARVSKAGITSTDLSYGIGAGVAPSCESTVGYKYSDWVSGGLIGLSQVGNTLTIESFSAGGSVDYSTPQDQIVFTLQ